MYVSSDHNSLNLEGQAEGEKDVNKVSPSHPSSDGHWSSGHHQGRDQSLSARLGPVKTEARMGAGTRFMSQSDPGNDQPLVHLY
ncbi:hypothetical protein RRG08_061597 [Elysia crispata]|uniref:Uncharacterized protein n=1 Tax=Elysia crispata TaxID=231223 RepID=A0AAE0YUL7_9GAST|nr:hypothetical protein RRG08_061597 [Elysia crispata]